MQADLAFVQALRGASLSYADRAALDTDHLFVLALRKVIELSDAEKTKLSADELAQRQKTWTRPEPRIKTGCLAKYAAMATSADTGAVLKW